MAKCPNCSANFANPKKLNNYNFDFSLRYYDGGEEGENIERCPSCGFVLTKNKKEKDKDGKIKF